MKKNRFYFLISVLSALFIYGIVFAEDRQLRSCLRKQDISETENFRPTEGKNATVAISIHHTGSTTHPVNYTLSLDLGRMKREAEMDVIFNNAYENPTSLNIISVFELVLDEVTYFKGLKRFLDGVETKVEKYSRKYKLKGEVGVAEKYHIETSDSVGQYSENVFSNLLPKRITWRFNSDLSSNYLKGEVNLGKYFVIEGNWGSDSDVKAMFTFPL